VDVHLKPGLGNIRVDQSQIQQIIINLAVNARDAMPEGGRLTIETAGVHLGEAGTASHFLSGAPPGDYVLLTMSDTGCGMSAEVKKHLFEPFFTTKAPGKGTGLGLATVYGIVKQHNGHIAVQSELGQGTTFNIYFPRVDAGREEIDEKAEAPAPVRGTETILLVEDAEMVRKLTHDILTANGYTVFSMASVTETLDWAQQYYGPIHLLLTDVVMPEMNGKELFMQLAPFRPEMKVLFMSGYTADVIVHHGMLEQGVQFLEKPFSVNGLLQKVREVLDN